MKTRAIFLSALLFACIPANAQPVIADIGGLNAASYILIGLPGEGVAQGAMFVVFGENLGPAAIVFPGTLPLPTEMANTSIEVFVEGITVDAHMVYTSTNQLAAVLPSTTPTGAGTLTVTYNGQTSAPASIVVVQHAFGIFTRNSAGRGPAIVQNWISHTEAPHLNGFTDSSEPGQIEILWGTGLGAIVGDDAARPPVGNLDVDVEVLVGGKRTNVLYKGRSYEFPGIDQIQFEVPQDVEGCYVPVTVKAGGVIGNYASMSIAPDGGVCSDPTSFSRTDLAKAAQWQETTVGGIAMLQVEFSVPPLPLVIRNDDGYAGFARIDPANLLASMGPMSLSLETPVPSPGTCTVYKYPADQSGGLVTPVDPVAAIFLDAGPTLNLSGPLGPKQIPQTEDRIYEATLGGGEPGDDEFLPNYLDPGQYTVDNGAGGTDVGPFQAMLTIPNPPFTWTNQNSILTVPRTQDLTVTWSGGDSANEYVVIGGASTRTDLQVIGSFVCTERSSAGQFTVPSEVLSNLPASSPWLGEDDPTSGLMVAAAPGLDAGKFTAQGLDVGYFVYAVAKVSVVPFE
jgi:uncharacterized protein (TIGR03437 family)